MGRKRAVPTTDDVTCRKQRKIAGAGAWLVCPLEVTIANTAWDVVALFKCYELNSRCRSLVCNTVQHNILGLLQGFLPDVVTGAWPYGSLKWLLTCAGSSTLNLPHVIDALLQLLDALHQDEARRVIQIAADAGLQATDKLVLAAVRRRFAHLELLLQYLAVHSPSHVEQLNPLYASVLLGDDCLLFQTGQRLGIKPLGEVIQQVTGDALPNLLRLACCRHKYTTAGHALLNHDATHIGLLHASGPSSEGSSNGAGAVCIEQEEQEQQQDSKGQQAEVQDAGQSAAQLICDCMETCIVKDNYELLECLVTLPGAGLIGTDSIYRLVYLALLYIAGQDDEGEVTDDHEECLLLLLQLPGAQGLSADDIFDLISHCWDLKVYFEPELLALPNACDLSSKQLCSMLRKAADRAMFQHDNVAFLQSVNRLLAHRQLYSPDVRDCIINWLKDWQAPFQLLFDAMLKLQLGRHLTCADVEDVYSYCVTNSRNTLTPVALAYLPLLAPAAAQMSIPSFKSLLHQSAQEAGGYTDFPQLLQLPAAQRLTPQDWQDILVCCFEACKCLLPSFEQHVSKEHITSSTVKQLLHLAVQLPAVQEVQQLAALPAAQGISKNRLYKLLSGLAKLGRSDGIVALMTLPKACRLMANQKQLVYRAAVRAEQWSCAIWLHEKLQLTDTQWRAHRSARLQSLLLAGAQECDHKAALALLQLPKAAKVDPEHAVATAVALLTGPKVVQDPGAADTAGTADAAAQAQSSIVVKCLCQLSQLPAMRKLQSTQMLQLLHMSMESGPLGIDMGYWVKLRAAQRLTPAELLPVLVQLLQSAPLHAGWKLLLSLPGCQRLSASSICSALSSCIAGRVGAGSDEDDDDDAGPFVCMLLQLPAARQLTSSQVAELSSNMVSGSVTGHAWQLLLSLPAARQLSAAQLKPLLHYAVLLRDTATGAGIARLPAAVESTDADMQLYLQMLQSYKPGSADGLEQV